MAPPLDLAVKVSFSGLFHCRHFLGAAGLPSRWRFFRFTSFLHPAMRRAERARLFLDLLEGALQRGQSVEAMILSIAQSRDRTVGVRFHMLAATSKAVCGLARRLEKVPRFLPPQIAAMLRAGEKLGDLKKVLPACREILRDRPAAVRSGMHYLIVVILLFSPAFILHCDDDDAFVVPKFKDVACRNGGIQMWPVTTFVFALNDSGWLVAFEMLVSLLLFGAHAHLHRRAGLCPLVSISWCRSWTGSRGTFRGNKNACNAPFPPCWPCCSTAACRKPKPSGSPAIPPPMKSAAAVRGASSLALEKGVKLDTAVRAFDDSGEFQWRLTNATHAHGGFLNALRGWHEALDAKAFQQEEATAHVLTSGLVILNGVLVALIATAMFGILMAFERHGITHNESPNHNWCLITPPPHQRFSGG
jgi:hypothetical protein